MKTISVAQKDETMKPADKNLLRQALKEDIGKGDVTSRLLVPAKRRGRAAVIAREKGIFYGAEIVREIFRISGGVTVRFFIKDGQAFRAGKTLFELNGRVRGILEGERTALNFLGHLCGVASKTKVFAEAAKKYGVKILDTRKTTTLLRSFEKKAVLAGGGMNHRMGLYDEIFVKENHRRYGSLEKLRRFPGKFEIEVRSLKEAAAAVKLKPRVILFDNFSPQALKKAAAYVRNQNQKIILEASGGITLQNVRSFASAGVDWISVGALTHSVKAVDLSLLIKEK